MVGRTFGKGLVVVALTSQMAFGASYYEAASNTVKDAGKTVANAVVNGASKGYNASVNAAVSAGKAVATKAHDVRVISGKALGKVGEGFSQAGMIVYGGAARQWAEHRDAYIVGLTLTGVAAVYAVYKYRKAHAAERQLEELKAQGYGVNA